jgi:hypothetical protein
MLEPNPLTNFEFAALLMFHRPKLHSQKRSGTN